MRHVLLVFAIVSAASFGFFSFASGVATTRQLVAEQTCTDLGFENYSIENNIVDCW